jgi:fused signal recognition particle receptor
MIWLSRLTSGLSKSSSNLAEGIGDIFTKKKLDAEALEALEDILVMADMGARTAAAIVEEMAEGRVNKDISEEAIKALLAERVAARLAPHAKPLDISAHAPCIIMMVGVNGNGKTTTIGKLAHHYTAQGKKVMLAAADTFRAAAVEQLQAWAARVGVPCSVGAEGADPASVAYKAVEAALAENVDVLLIDTAGRLHTKTQLMDELAKMIRTVQKLVPDAPHHVIQVLDATTGQNALAQAKAFQEVAGVTGLVVSKLDGTAKAGVVVALAEQLGLPIHLIGVGEAIDDLQPFDAPSFAAALVGYKGEAHAG